MSISDRIAKALARKHAKVLTASGWFTEAHDSEFEDVVEVNYQSARLMLGDVEITCKVADDSELQVRGLQGHEGLGPYEGMIFPQEQPRRVAFHMGKVSFPIDMIFVADDSRISKIVENVEPGQAGQWGMPHVLAVIEMNGGFCAAHDIQVGTEVRQSAQKTAQTLPPIASDSYFVSDDLEYSKTIFTDGTTLYLDVGDNVAVVISKDGTETVIRSDDKSNQYIQSIYGSPSSPKVMSDAEIAEYAKVMGWNDQSIDDVPPEPKWPESEIIDWMRQFKYEFKIPADKAIAEAIANGCSGTPTPAPDEVKYLHSIYKMAQEKPRCKRCNSARLRAIETDVSGHFYNRCRECGFATENEIVDAYGRQVSNEMLPKAPAEPLMDAGMQQVREDQSLEHSEDPAVVKLQDDAVALLKKFTMTHPVSKRHQLRDEIASPAGQWLLRHGLIEMKDYARGEPIMDENGETIETEPTQLPYLTVLGKNFIFGLGRAPKYNGGEPHWQDVYAPTPGGTQYRNWTNGDGSPYILTKDVPGTPMKPVYKPKKPKKQSAASDQQVEIDRLVQTMPAPNPNLYPGTDEESSEGMESLQIEELDDSQIREPLDDALNNVDPSWTMDDNLLEQQTQVYMQHVSKYRDAIREGLLNAYQNLKTDADPDRQEGYMILLPDEGNISELANATYRLESYAVGDEPQVAISFQNFDRGGGEFYTGPFVGFDIEEGTEQLVYNIARGAAEEYMNTDNGFRDPQEFEITGQADLPPKLTEQLATTMFPEAMTALKTFWPDLSDTYLYAYVDTIGACQMNSDEPEIYWDGDQWVVFNGDVHTAQETFPSHTRKDINPKMVTHNPTNDRFKGHDLVDKQVDSPAFSPLNEESTGGGDLTIDIHNSDGIDPSVRPL